MNRPLAKEPERNLRMDPPITETDWSVADFFARAGNVVCRKHPTNITYDRAVKFLKDPEFQKIVEGDIPYIVGKFLWDSWTFDLDLNIYTNDVEAYSLQRRLESIYDLGYNKHNIQIDVSYFHDTEKSVLPQRHELIEANKDSGLEIDDWIWKHTREFYRINPTIVSYYGEPSPETFTIGSEKWTDKFSKAIEHILKDLHYFIPLNDNVHMLSIKYANRKIIKNIYDSKKENLMHKLLVEDFLNMTEEQFNKIKNY